ncbi:MAG: DUF72 domain-containing protein, partial [Candidatus Micrarchaeaceae archaeon]
HMLDGKQVDSRRAAAIILITIEDFAAVGNSHSRHRESDWAYGRNYKTWFSENAHPHERYDYLYSLDQLAPWVDRIKAVLSQAEDTYVVSNNHYLGKATVNAIEIISILRGQPVKVPPSLLEHYSEPKEFATFG